jgi:hypothetical protein
MPVTRQEIDSFHQFAHSQLGTSQPPESLQDCLNQYRQQREYEETVADLRQAKSESEAGLGIPLEEAAELLREELRLSTRQR